jgi:aspartate oxidase
VLFASIFLLIFRLFTMPDQNNASVYDVIIVGSGAAGLTLALSLPTHLKVAVLAKSVLTEASTYYAQGGVAAVLDETDSVDQHIEDTLMQLIFCWSKAYALLWMKQNSCI